MYTYKLSLGEKIQAVFFGLLMLVAGWAMGCLIYDEAFMKPIVFTGKLIDKNITCEILQGRAGTSFDSQYTISVLSEGTVTTYSVSDDVYYFSPVGEDITFQCIESGKFGRVFCEDSILVK